MRTNLKLLVIGAHPDDAEFKAGGLSALYRAAGHQVRFVSVTDGGAGHHVTSGPPLVARRRLEAARAAESIGVEHEIWSFPDGRLEPSLALREQVIRRIRTYKPDLVLTHRLNDYHPDHRVTSLAVQDAAYLLTVPAICPDAPHLPRDPVIAYLQDDFTRPCAFEPTVALDVSEAWDDKVGMLDAHESQFYEWLPYNAGYLDEVPLNAVDRRHWLSQRLEKLSRGWADRVRPTLEATYGKERAATLAKVEAFEGCEYGSPLDEAAIARLFPFLPRREGDSPRRQG